MQQDEDEIPEGDEDAEGYDIDQPSEYEDWVNADRCAFHANGGEGRCNFCED